MIQPFIILPLDDIADADDQLESDLTELLGEEPIIIPVPSQVPLARVLQDCARDAEAGKFNRPKREQAAVAQGVSTQTLAALDHLSEAVKDLRQSFGLN